MVGKTPKRLTLSLRRDNYLCFLFEYVAILLICHKNGKNKFQNPYVIFTERLGTVVKMRRLFTSTIETITHISHLNTVEILLISY